ncbi:MAG: hypothetical protein F6K28_24450 [Microcoleus sp. SIO2G3]|nr:hypothetical protein [Microcoleus sp. SIO2G3]
MAVVNESSKAALAGSANLRSFPEVCRKLQQRSRQFQINLRILTEQNFTLLQGASACFRLCLGTTGWPNEQ